jgi:hypothetical protein
MGVISISLQDASGKEIHPELASIENEQWAVRAALMDYGFWVGLTFYHLNSFQQWVSIGTEKASSFNAVLAYLASIRDEKSSVVDPLVIYLKRYRMLWTGARNVPD